MKTFKAIAFLTLPVLMLLSCQQVQDNKESKPAAVTENTEAKPDHSYQFSLADNSMAYPYAQLELGYAFDALEPNIDQATMELHYTKHHAGYTANFNKAVEENALTGMKLFEIFDRMSEYPAGLRNNGGGFYNHVMFWQVMSPDGGGDPGGKLAKAITSTFGSMDAFREEFGKAGKTVFGSGWAWLSVSPEGKLFISTTPNQDNPLMDVVKERGIPILALDVWEHAYYLKYQNKRPDYVTNFWNVVNWAAVERRYDEALAILK